ncbi:MAG: sigma 54-interacting transcriptional regulator [Anaerotruncus massiliensis (ex Togo et al. 2019)]
MTDGSAVTLMINKSYEAISGLRREEVLGKDMRTLETTGVISRSGTLLAIEAGTSVTLEQTFRRPARDHHSTPTFDQTQHRDGRYQRARRHRDVRLRASLRRAGRSPSSTGRAGGDAPPAGQPPGPDRRRRGDDRDDPHGGQARAARRDGAHRERGFGKSTVAKHIHSKSARKKGKFVTVSCGAIPPETMNEELGSRATARCAPASRRAAAARSFERGGAASTSR